MALMRMSFPLSNSSFPFYILMLFFCRFHDIMPQENLTIGPPGRLSTKVVAPVKGSIPWPNLTDNTLVLSDNIVVAPIDGQMQLQFRQGDSHCNIN